MKKYLTISFIFILSYSYGQVFTDYKVKSLVKKAAECIYNASYDSACVYISQTERILPDHPVVPLMRAMNILWTHIPMIDDSLFQLMEEHLSKAIMLAEKQDPQLEDPEFIYFAMASHGLLAEYYADRDYYLKAASEANRAYGLIKKGFDLVNNNPEFLLTTGLYNYFREKYPERYPVYKPLLWFFRSGDMELGLRQLKAAVNDSFFSSVEAQVYLSYIYLRFEYQPQIAQKYLSNLCLTFPNNSYAKAKYLESMANPEDFRYVDVNDILSLSSHDSEYYKLAGNVFLGYHLEVIQNRPDSAMVTYKKALGYGEGIPDHGEFFKSFGYLGLGRLQMNAGMIEEASESLHSSLKYAETHGIKEESRELLSKL